MAHFVGLDVAKRNTRICVMNAGGEIVEEGSAPTTPKDLVAFLRGRRRRYGRVGLESSATAFWLCDGLAKAGLPAICVETRHAHRLLSTKTNKTDRNDARGIAELMRIGAYRSVHVKSLESRRMKALLSARRVLLNKRVDIELAIRGLLREGGYKLSICSAEKYADRVRNLLCRDEFFRSLAEPLLRARAVVMEEAARLTSRVTEWANTDPVSARLMTAPGVGPLVALDYRATVDDPSRFMRARSVGAYLGLTPRVHQSGDDLWAGRIPLHCADGRLRANLYLCAGTILTRCASSSLQVWGRRIAERRGRGKARIAVARRLAVVLLAMWRSGTDFRWEAVGG
jgi:transposase